MVPGVERSTKMLVPVPVVGVVRIPGPASTQDLKEASSFVLISGIALAKEGPAE